ncbi:hypothetical protein Dimus_032603 [Dionaea muscipula]
MIPYLLNCDVDKTLTPKIRAFQDLGLSVSSVIDLFVQCPSIMMIDDLKSVILPKLELLKSILGSDENVLKAIRRSSWLLSGNNPAQMQENVILLQKYGVSSERIQKLAIQNPDCLLHERELVEGSLAKVEELMGIKPESAMFIHAFPLMLVDGEDGESGEEALRSKFDVFKSHGWTEMDITKLAKKHPAVFKYSGDVLESKLNFVMRSSDMSRSMQHVGLLTLSLQSRIVPRAAVFRLLKEKKLLKTDCSLYTVLGFKEARFLSELVTPYKELLPEMYDAYLNKRMASQTESEE